MSFFKKPAVIILLIISAGIIGVLIYRTAAKKTVYEYTAVKRGTVIQEVSATGRVKAAASVDLAFETGGKVGAVYVKVGSRVFIGQKLAALAAGTLAADLAKAEANLKAEQAALAEMEKGTRPEEITIAETDLMNAKNKAAADLQEDYDAALTAAGEAAIKGKNALITISDLQFKYFINTEQDSINLTAAKKIAMKSMLGADNAGSLATEDVSKLDGGAYGVAQNATANPSYANIDDALSQIASALQDVKAALDAVKVTTSFTATEKSEFSTAKTTIASETTNISGKQQVIAVQKITNANNIAAAEAALALKKAGSTPEEILTEEAKVESLEASVRSAEAALAKTIIIAPIGGIVTKQDAKLGEIVAADTNVISLISEADFEIEANIPEADIAKIKAGDAAEVTLDAYGNDVVFSAKVIKIDPAETLIEGVATYKTTFQFTEDDERVKSGMTANIDIIADKKENVLYIPARAIYAKDGKKYVKILRDETAVETEIKLGIRGSDGNVEVLKGVAEGDDIITK